MSGAASRRRIASITAATTKTTNPRMSGEPAAKRAAMRGVMRKLAHFSDLLEAIAWAVEDVSE